MAVEQTRESDVERYLGKRLKELGCLYYKFVSPGTVGVPDRIVVTPAGHVIFVELKNASGKLSEAQELVIRRLRKNKADVCVAYGMVGANLVVSYVSGLLGLLGGDST